MEKGEKMKIARKCISCIVRQIVEIAEESSEDEEVQEKIIKESLKEMGNIDFNKSAPEIAYKIHEISKNITGIRDPYVDLKREYNEIANDIYEMIVEEEWMEKADDPFDLGCRLAIAGNIIDFSVGLNLDYQKILDSVKDSISRPIFGAGVEALKKAVKKAKYIMYIGDNTGEIIFDKFLIEELPKEKVVYVVKGGAIVNDATMEDAISSKMTDLVRVIDNGHSAQGTILKDCSEDFLNEFNRADLTVSKGQANFETLSPLRDKSIFYLMRAKCSVIADEVKCREMDYVLTDLK